MKIWCAVCAGADLINGLGSSIYEIQIGRKDGEISANQKSIFLHARFALFSVETFRRKLQRRNNRIQPCLEDHLEAQNLFTFHGLHGGWALEMLSNEKRKKFRRGNANFLHIFQVCPRAARELALIWEVFSFRFEKPNWLRGKIARTDRCTWASVNFRLHYFNGAGARWERQSFILSAGLSRVCNLMTSPAITRFSSRKILFFRIA